MLVPRQSSSVGNPRGSSAAGLSSVDDLAPMGAVEAAAPRAEGLAPNPKSIRPMRRFEPPAPHSAARSPARGHPRQSPTRLSIKRVWQALRATGVEHVSYNRVRRLLKRLGAERPVAPSRRIECAPGDEIKSTSASARRSRCPTASGVRRTSFASCSPTRARPIATSAIAVRRATSCGRSRTPSGSAAAFRRRW